MNEHDPYSDLERRVERLEKLVKKLVEREVKPGAPPVVGKRLAKQAPATEPTPLPIKRPPLVVAEKPKPKSGSEPKSSADERWLARFGVLFLFLALSFLFKYAIDHSWFDPPVRVAIGVVVATAMLITGLKLHATRLRYSQILLGGSVAIYYLCGYAAHNLYGLFEHTPTFFYMVGVTIGALLLAVKQDHPSLACIGIAGGLSTPFMLPTPWGTIPALVIYASTVLLGGGVILLRRGWRTLGVTLWFGGLPVLFYCIEEIQQIDRDFLAVGIPVWWAIGGVLPMIYNWKSQRFPAPSAQPMFSGAALRVAAVTSSFFAFVLAAWNWRLHEREELWPLAMLFAVGYALIAATAHKQARSLSVAIEMAVAGTALTLAIALEEDWAFLSLLAHVAVTLWLARHQAFATSRYVCYGVLLGLSLWFGGDCLEYLSLYGERDPMLTPWTRLMLLPTLLWAAQQSKYEVLQNSIRGLAYIGLLIWSFTELRYRFESGMALTTAAWALQGGITMLVGLQTRQRSVQNLALGALALVSGKMLIFDMADLDMLWRILLFFGVGAAFLGLSYLMNRPGARAADDSDRPSS